MRVDIAQTVEYAAVSLPSRALSENLGGKSERCSLSKVGYSAYGTHDHDLFSP